MGAIGKVYKKIKDAVLFSISAPGKEIRRIKKIPRYTYGHTNLLGFDMMFVDSISFCGQYFEIIKKQIYNFKTQSKEPYIIDCGANVGMSIVYFKELYPHAHVVAFEPDKDIFLILEKNISHINNENITLINKGLWNYEGKIKFLIEKADGGSILTNEDTSSQIPDIAQIETTTLRKYLDREVDFLKIDIEGAEAIVLEDCDDLLKNVKHIFIENHSTVSKTQQLDSILSVLKKNGFRYFIESTTILNDNPFIARKTINNYDNLLNIYAYK